jgi:N-formylglutamate deformylase
MELFAERNFCMPKFPVLILVPHGGYRIPEELEEVVSLDTNDLLLSADTGANDIFLFESCAILNTHISRLFVDLDRAPLDINIRASDGVMKTRTFLGYNVFENEMFPDHIAIANILKRHHAPFYDAVHKILSTGEIKLVIECHTVAAVGPRLARDKDIPRPLISVSRFRETTEGGGECCPLSVAEAVISNLARSFSAEDHALDDPYKILETPIKGNLAKTFADRNPWLRLNLSRALFINDSYFSYEFAKIDNIRLASIRARLEEGLSRAFGKVFHG